MSVEQRRNPRRSIQAPGVVHCGRDCPLRPCTVHNVSVSGAKLRLNGARDVPDEFTLILSRGGGVRRKCRVVWRSDREVGVRFVWADERPKPAADGKDG